MNRTTLRIGLAVAVLASLAACGGDDEPDASDPVTTEPTTDDTAAGPDGPNSSDPGTTEPGESVAFPVTIEHKYGETTIDAEPQRVVSVGFAEHDIVLALGVRPVGVRDWYGEQPFATWPWAQDELGDAEPAVIAAAELNFEQIASLDPDLILGIGSGMTDTDYATLSAIAPTVAQPGEYPDYATPWRAQLEITGRALGRSDAAAQVLADTEQLFADARAAHPEFEGATASVAFAFEELPGAYSSSDIRSQLLIELGFTIPPEFDELAGDAFYFSVSQEELSTLDADVLVWVVSDDAGYGAIRSMPLRPSLTAYSEGREIVADPLLSGAFSHASPLSLEYVIDDLVPELALAVDGDPTTEVPSVGLLAEAEPGTSGEDLGDDEQAAADAWSRVFDSTVGYDDKAAHLDDAAALEATVAAYTTAGEAMGGITLEPTRVVVDGDSATVTYDVMFDGTAAYTALEGEITRTDGVWTVSRDEFCTFMASARNACPTP